MSKGVWFLVALGLLNFALALAVALLAPATVGTTADRVGYEFVAQHPLAPDCPHNIYCYRVLVPAVLEHVDLPPVVRWRVFAVIANTLTGVVLARLTAGAWAAVLASVLFQTSYAAMFALFDPFTPDPAVFLAGALIALAWLRDRPLAALFVALVAVFAKETVALVLAAAALAAVFDRRRPRPWLIATGIVWVVLLGFHLVMNRFAGWSEAGSGSADLAGGSWLARWLADPTLSTTARLLYIFVPFGFAWLYAAFGARAAPHRLQMLALASLIVLPGLVYVQTVERALGTASYVVVPLAAMFLARAPAALGLLATVTNGLMIGRVALSNPSFPPLPLLLVAAAIVAAATCVAALSADRSRPPVLVGT